MPAESARNVNGLPVRTLAISAIRKDGNTQHRDQIDEKVVAEYAELMQDGVRFPPVQVWWDGQTYWLSDGFHRIAAAEKCGFAEFDADVYHGSLADAQWHSFSVNGTHGLRWSSSEVQRVIDRALAHPNAAQTSNVEIAKHLHVCESTVRRRRQKLFPAHAEEHLRNVSRRGKQYTITVQNIGRSRAVGAPKSRRDVNSGLEVMKTGASSEARRLVNIIQKWILGAATPEECLKALESVLQSVRSGSTKQNH